MLERFAFGIDAQPDFDNRADNHEDGANEIPDEQSRSRAGADDPAEQNWRPYPAGQSSERIKDRDRERANFEGKI